MNNNIRNFVIIAHVDHGKSTLADRMLEITGTVEARKMRPQYLDQLELERERGITIKMAPVRMIYHPDRGPAQTSTRTSAEGGLLYQDLTYKIRGAIFSVKKNLGLGHKEVIYQRALEEEFKKHQIAFEREKTIDLLYDGKKIGIYQPDFVVSGKVIIELKSLPFIGQTEEKQLWSYLNGSDYKVGLLVNFGGKDVDIKRVVLDTARPRESAQVKYVLNLIDTPGHSDFQYEVSRALAAVEGAVLLVDVTKGIQAQTLSNLRQAKKNNLKIIGAVNKVDLLQTRTDADSTQTSADIQRIIKDLADLIGCEQEEIHRISGKTGMGVEGLLQDVIAKIPPSAPLLSAFSPRESAVPGRALIFDSFYDDHKGILAYVRIMDGEIKAGTEVELMAGEARCKIKEVGCFAPELKTVPSLGAGEIGYLATGLKEPSLVKIGDTILAGPANLSDRENLRLPGYREASPVVFISFYPDGATEFDDLKRGFERLHLTDSALNFEPDANEALGRGLKAGFLGQLHFEITASRLEREFGLKFLTSFPSIAYRVKEKGEWRVVKDAHQFPDNPEEVMQPMIKVEIVSPAIYLNVVVSLQQAYQLEVAEIHTVGESVLIHGRMPLAELIRDFDDKLKSVSAGYASFSYELDTDERADVEKLEILIAGEVASALTRVVFRKDLEREGRATVEKLKDLLPRQQFSQPLQASSGGRIIARETIPALKKKLGDFGKNGGDRTRKMKLWKKQERGKERLQESAHVELSVEVFREILKK